MEPEGGEELLGGGAEGLLKVAEVVVVVVDGGDEDGADEDIDKGDNCATNDKGEGYVAFGVFNFFTEFRDDLKAEAGGIGEEDGCSESSPALGRGEAHIQGRGMKSTDNAVDTEGNDELYGEEHLERDGQL